MVVMVIVFPMVWILAVVGFVDATGIGEATPGGGLPRLLAVLLLIGVPISAVLAFGEEFGWRGYLLPRLLPLGELNAAGLVALVWGPWHLPVLLVGLNYPGENIIALLGTFMLSVLMLSILHTRVYVASGGSLVLVALLHGSLNDFADRLTDPDHLSGATLVVNGGGLIASAMLAPILVVVYRRLRGRSGRRSPVLMMRSRY
jgi:membrane protease YdiL (CAAX protease family)